MTSKTTGDSAERSFKSIVTVDRYQPHFFDFDKEVDVSEIPVKKKFAIAFTGESGNTINAESSFLFEKKIRIVFSKNESLQVDDAISLSLLAIHKKLTHDYFLNIPCTLSKVEQFDHVSHAEITFSAQANTEFTNWYQQWLANLKNAKNREEINRDAFNFLYQYYKRLYCDHLPYPILFSDKTQIKRAYLSKVASTNISFITENETAVHLPANAIQPYITLPSKINRIPLYAWYEKGQVHFFSKTDYPELSPIEIISWLITKPQWRVLLIRNRKITFANKRQRKEIVQYFTDNISQNDSTFEDDFFKLCISTNVLDISCLFKQIDLPDYQQELQENQSTLPGSDVDYHRISFKIKRYEMRYDTISQVKLSTLYTEEQVAAETVNVSLQGLNIKLMADSCPFREHDSVMVEFTQWNDEMPRKLLLLKDKIEQVEYKIMSINKQLGHIALGVKLVTRENDSNFRDFIKNKIKAIKKIAAGSLRNSSDVYQSLVSSLWINNNIAGLVFFIGKDSKGIHIIQAIANTKGNQKLRQPFVENNDWSFLQQHAFNLVNAVKEINNLGLYCYYDDINSPQQWHTKTDMDFDSVKSKADFIKTAISFKKHFFYHCSLSPIIPGKDDILNGESSSLVSLGQHRLKEIHQICRSLAVIGELNDVTRLIEFFYNTTE